MDKGHGRVEERTVTVYEVPGNFRAESLLFENTETIIKVYRKTQIFETKPKEFRKREEISYYTATFTANADKMAEIIRKHWGIENKNNYVRDNALKEDLSRIRINPGIVARLRSFALNILRFNDEQNIKGALQTNSLNFNNVLNYLGIF